MKKVKSIGELLIEFGKITRSDLEKGLKNQVELGLRLGETLVKLGKVSRADIEWVLSKQLDIPFVIVENISVNNRLIDKFPKPLLLENRILPLYETDNEIAIATDDPLNTEAFESMEALSGKVIELSTGNGEKIEEILRHFFKISGVPDLVGSVKGIIEKIKGTSFYRLDFIVSSCSCTINIFGCGILKNMAVLGVSYTEEQIFGALEQLNLKILYDRYANGYNLFLSVYPLVNVIEDMRFPAVIGCFGLFLPESTSFTDTHSGNISHILHSSVYVCGYPFISTKTGTLCQGKTVFTIDSVPEKFDSLYAILAMPKKCDVCGGSGCLKCNDLGYNFEKLEGLHSSEELGNLLNEGRSWQR